MSFLIDKNKIINIKIYYTEIDNIFKYAKSKEELIDTELNKIKELEFIFKHPSYGDNLDVINSSTSVSSEGLFTIQPLKLRYNRFVKLLKSWSLTDSEGNLYPITQEVIYELDPVLANIVMEALEDRLNNL